MQVITEIDNLIYENSIGNILKIKRILKVITLTLKSVSNMPIGHKLAVIDKLFETHPNLNGAAHSIVSTTFTGFDIPEIYRSIRNMIKSGVNVDDIISVLMSAVRQSTYDNILKKLSFGLLKKSSGPAGIAARLGLGISKDLHEAAKYVRKNKKNINPKFTKQNAKQLGKYAAITGGVGAVVYGNHKINQAIDDTDEDDNKISAAKRILSKIKMPSMPSFELPSFGSSKLPISTDAIEMKNTSYLVPSALTAAATLPFIAKAHTINSKLSRKQNVN